MSAKPDFNSMTQSELRAYVLDHRDDDEALHAFIDKRRAENPPSRKYGAGDDISAAIDEYLKQLEDHRK
ncbi:hypothetical protein LEP3755_34480 [Leptolyngbya sp. NIES-3755]|nr:hypothetical protein LEP3755_34480 [Leptolyngbya sp. NIES-3755]